MHTDTPLMPASPRPSPPLARRLARLAWWVRGLALLGSLVLLALPAWIVTAGPDQAEPIQGLFGGHVVGLSDGGLTPAVRWRLAGVTVLPISLALLALWQLWCLFGAYRLGDVFGRQPVAHLRRFGWALVALALAQPVSTSLASVAVSLDNGPGRRMLVVQLGSQDYALLMCALVVVALGRVIAEAARLAEDNEGFV